MFDSTPPNLPVENSRPKPPADVPPSVQPAINQSGIKEPEDIFADIKDPDIQAALGGEQKSLPVNQSSSGGSFWKVAAGVGIPLVVIGLGIGGYLIYSSYTASQGAVKPPSQNGTVSGTVPATVVPDDKQAIPNPVAPPDEERAAANQAAIALMQAQADQAYAEYATSPPMEELVLTDEQIEQATGSEATVVPPANIPLPIGQTSDEIMLIQVPLGIDSDGDGLTNSEEALLGTNPESMDSDGDGFQDLSEIENGYDPAAPGAKLDRSMALKTEVLGSMQFLMPSAWDRQPGAEGSVVLRTGTQAVIGISVQPYAGSASLLDWLVGQRAGSTAEDYQAQKNANDAHVVYSKDRMTAWLLIGNSVYQFNYELNGAPTKDFEIIFEKIIINQAS